MLDPIAGILAGTELSAADIAQLKAAPAAGMVTISGVSMQAGTGELDAGGLQPSAEPLDLPAELDGIVRPAAEALDPVEINKTFNPFLNDPKGPDGKPLIGPYLDPSRIFNAKVTIPLRETATKFAATAGPDIEKILPLVSEYLLFDTPAHRFNIPGGIGNRVVFYGGDVGHTHIDHVVRTMRARNMRMVKAIGHFSTIVAQGGRPEDISTYGTGGSSHLGGYSVGYQRREQATTVKSDWPYEESILNDSQELYGAHILAIDYSKGTHDPIPDRELAAYSRNADMWDAIAGILVPFANEGEIDPTYIKYDFNALDVYDQKSARALAAAMATLDQKKFLIEHGAFYCAEGQYCIANLGPQEDEQGGTLLKRSRFGNTPLGALIDNFSKAPGYLDNKNQVQPVEYIRKRPRIGWEHLKSLGTAQGGISEDQFYRLEQSERIGLALEWLPEDIKGWQAFRPRNAEGLIARPMTVATMAWALFRRYLPREALAQVMAGEMLRLHERVPGLKQALAGLTGGLDPSQGIGKMALSLIASRLAAKMLTMALSEPAAKAKILQKAGGDQMPDPADKAKLEAVYAGMLELVLAKSLASQAEFDNALIEADKKLSGLKVTLKQANKDAFFEPANAELVADLKVLMEWIDKSQEARDAATPDVQAQMHALLAREQQIRADADAKLYMLKPGSTMLFAAPACFVAWAQQPFLAETGCLRYVATAMHVKQSRHLKPGGPPIVSRVARPGVTSAADALDGKVWNILGQTCVAKQVSDSCFSWYGYLPPGCAVPAHVHPTQDEHVYVLDGVLSVNIAGRDSTAGSADLVHLPRGIPHAYANRGDRPVNAVFWVSPSRRLWELFDALDGVTDPAKVAQLAAQHEIDVLSVTG